MADTPLVLATVRSALYRELGEPAADLPNVSGGVLEEKVRYAAKTISRQMGRSSASSEEAKLGTLTLVANQQTYTIPDDRDLVEVFWSPPVTEGLTSEPTTLVFPNIPTSSLGVGESGFYWESDRTIDRIRKRQVESTYQWTVIDGLLYLYPVPTAAGTLRYTYTNEIGDVTSLTVAHETAVLYIAAAECCRVMANRLRGRGNMVTSEGLVQASEASAWEAAEAKYRERGAVEIAELIG